MGASSHHKPILAAAAVLAAAAAGCSVGVGEGEVTGQVWAPDCDLNGEELNLDPSFFAANPGPDGTDDLLIRIQDGSASPEISDGLLIQVDQASEVQSMLGSPLPLASTGTTGAISMTLYLNDECPFRVGDPEETPVAYVATSGTITFDAIYAPEADEGQKQTTAHFEDVLLVDTAAPDERRAILGGYFDFIFSRGRPATPFP